MPSNLCKPYINLNFSATHISRIRYTRSATALCQIKSARVRLFGQLLCQVNIRGVKPRIQHGITVEIVGNDGHWVVQKQDQIGICIHICMCAYVCMDEQSFHRVPLSSPTFRCFCAIAEAQVSLLALFDDSTAFETVDHDIQISRLLVFWHSWSFILERCLIGFDFFTWAHAPALSFGLLNPTGLPLLLGCRRTSS